MYLTFSEALEHIAVTRRRLAKAKKGHLATLRAKGLKESTVKQLAAYRSAVSCEGALYNDAVRELRDAAKKPAQVTIMKRELAKCRAW